MHMFRLNPMHFGHSGRDLSLGTRMIAQPELIRPFQVHFPIKGDFKFKIKKKNVSKAEVNVNILKLRTVN